VSCLGALSCSVAPLSCVSSRPTRGQPGPRPLPRKLAGLVPIRQTHSRQIHLRQADAAAKPRSGQAAANEVAQMKPRLREEPSLQPVQADKAAAAGGASAARLPLPSICHGRTGRPCTSRALRAVGTALPGIAPAAPRRDAPRVPAGCFWSEETGTGLSQSRCQRAKSCRATQVVKQRRRSFS